MGGYLTSFEDGSGRKTCPCVLLDLSLLSGLIYKPKLVSLKT